MIIGIDAGPLSITDARLQVGVWRVTKELVKQLAILDTTNTYRLYSFLPLPKEITNLFSGRMENIVVTPTKGWTKIWLPLELARHPVDVYMGLAQSIVKPLSVKQTKQRNIGFIYDLGFLYYPDLYKKSYKQLVDQTQHLVNTSQHIITISERSKHDIISQYGISDEVVHVAYLGVDSLFSPLGEKYKHTSPYILFVGSLVSSKNIPHALEVFHSVLKKYGKPLDFLLVGGDYWPDPEIKKTIEKYQLEKHVHILGHVDDSELANIYRGATVFFTTSLHEGFCLPALEAMASGCPVIASDSGAMKEIVGDGGIVSHETVHDIADVILSILENSTLRKTLSMQAIRRAKQFHWNTFGQQIFTLIKTLEK